MYAKIDAFLLTAVLLLSGCGTSSEDEALANKQAAYKVYYEAVQAAPSYSSSSVYYSVSTEMAQVSDGTYRYYIFIEDPQMAMYNITALAVEDDIAYENADKMMPSVGIFDDTSYSMIPYQSNPDAGFVKGLVLSGESADSSVSIRMLVQWNDSGKKGTYQEFLAFEITPAGMQTDTATEAAEG